MEPIGKTSCSLVKKKDFEAIKSEFSIKGGGREPLFRGTVVDINLERVKKILS